MQAVSENEIDKNNKNESNNKGVGYDQNAL